MIIRSRSFATWRRVVALSLPILLLLLTGRTVAQSPQAVDQLAQTIAALEIVAQELPREGFDPRAIVDEVGTDPAALFEWVRDNTYLVPYKGVLRGPTGVLMDRMGNSLDRALLLRELLKLAGHNAILATGTLSIEEALSLLANRRPLPDTILDQAETQSLADMQAIIDRIGAETELDIDDLLADLEARRNRTGDAARQLQERGEAQVRALLNGIETVPSIDRNDYARLMTEHWWVEIQLPTNIVDLDPSLPEAKVGELITEPLSRFDPTSPNQLRGIPDTAHTLTIRVIIERFEEGSLTEEEVLVHEFLPAEHYGQRIVLSHAPLSGDGAQDVLALPDPQSWLRDQMLGQEEWQPQLLIGSDVISDKVFTKEGVVKSEPGGAVGAVGGFGGGLMGGFGGAVGGASSESHLTAEWIEYVIAIPGRDPVVERRAVFDLIGPRVRSNGGVGEIDVAEFDQERPALSATQTEIVVLPSRYDEAYRDTLYSDALLANKDVLLAVVRGDVPPAAVPAQLPGFPVELAIAAEEWADYDLFHDRLSVFTFHTQVHFGVSEITVLEGFDIVHDGMLGSLADDAFAERVRRGVFITNAEGLLLASESQLLSNAAASMAIDDQRGIGWKAYTVVEQLPTAEGRIQNDLRTMLASDIQNGFLVVAPSAFQTTDEGLVQGWWRVNTATGQTLGFGHRGWGDSLTEYLQTTDKILSNFLCFVGAIEGHKAGSDVRTGAKLALCLAGNSTIFMSGDRVKNFNLAMGLIGKVVGITGLKAFQ